MAKLTYEQRKKMSSKEFVFPDEKAYPIPDEAHGRNALARASQHENGARLAKVVNAVRRKFPNIEIDPMLLRKARRGG
jgi:hypothetical protein